ncbi:unnamed protein product [Alopecurus aequalis]
MPPTKYKARAAAYPAAVKVRKQRATKPRPPSLTHAEWKADVDRRSIVYGERAKRGVAKKKRDAAAAEEEASRELLAKDRQQPRPPHASQYAQGDWAASQQSVVSPASFSPPLWPYSSSPDYADGDVLGGFNPNTTFQARGPPSFPVDQRASPAFAIDLNSPYRNSPTYSSSPNLRCGALPFGPGSSSTPQFSATDAEINDMITTGSVATAASEGFYVEVREPGAETEYTEQEDATEEAEEVDAPDPRVAGKRGRGRPQCKLVDPEYAGLHTDRGEKAMANHWAVIQQACNKWHDIQEEVAARPVSGANIERRLSPGTRRPSTTRTCLSSGRPIGNKKAKAARDMAPAAERLPSSIDQYIADAKSDTVVREEKSEARWTALMKKQDAKLDLLRTNVAAKKRNNDVAFQMGADTAAMDPLVRAWFMEERTIILTRCRPRRRTMKTPRRLKIRR